MLIYDPKRFEKLKQASHAKTNLKRDYSKKKEDSENIY